MVILLSAKVFVLKILCGVSGNSGAIQESFLQQNFAFAKLVS